MLDDSLKQYMKAIELDPLNEYALSNIGVIYLKRQNYDNCLQFTNASLEIIENFHADTKEFGRDNLMEVKLLQRRAKCYEVQENWELAKADLDRAQLLDKENPAVNAAQKKVQEKLNTFKFNELKEQADGYL